MSVRSGERFRSGGCGNGQSFSSSLLDEIYRSIDDGGDKRSGELKFYRQKVLKKQGKVIGKAQNDVEDEEIASLHRALLIERWIEKKVAEKVSAQRRRSLTEGEIKFQLYQHDREEDVLFFSSTSSSSDSSFGGFSSSDTESMYGSKSLTPSCFAKFRPKPIRTSVSAPPPEKTEAKQRQSREKPQSKQSNQFVENKEKSRGFDENAMIKSKSRALKIYTNLKKVKQPISPGGRLSSFLNSIFTAGTPKKTGNSVSSTTVSEDPNSERKSKSGQTSTCSSAASFSRSCLSKNSPCSSEKLRNADRRTVRFYPVSTIVDEYCRPCGHKSLYEEEDPKFQIKNKAETTESTSRKNTTDYQQQMRKKNDFLIRNFHHPDNDLSEEDDETASCSSSDLFELDHLREMSGGCGNRYREELPVYESTTRVDTNRAIRHC
ncbi:protein BIG GRAIN 1-like B [Cucumis melo var. makuwa]|uniref:Protein BIG GRAIN 1-like B n=2 Tax=Cucumis melo TaxID=3656 RepID=A0A1S3BVF5_CUCME|nr:protein BIG GRAIN 1-like B [Cucumis melo]KAA0064527.1 protein BIG GRAIN 1-like B [Cucumis melo var. makuwa]TYK20063.1 protein BIG GRAIN 1-like B [Cucumis melo var. makuwa]